MTYKVLSLKWRPQVFSDIVGQDHVTKTLVNAFKKERVAQGYIFTGPRGVGKTTTARILSMALNAEGGPRYDFDPNTTIAMEISQGRALDVLEIDGASNRGIEEIRNLREQIKFAPMVGQYKVIIIDEVHMLTNPAFNALLRTLEEPPAHGKFIFCTTDIHKVPATIISRCQRFDFNRIATDTIISRISFILEKEKIKADEDSLQIIARKADGSMRDGLSILDQVISFCGSDINYEQTVSALGIIPNDLYFDYTKALLDKNGTVMIEVLDRFGRYGVPASEVNNGIRNHLKNLLYSKITNGIDLLDMNKENKNLYLAHAAEWDNRDLLRISQTVSDVATYINRSEDPYLILEITALKLLEMDKSVALDKLFESGNLPMDENDQVIEKKKPKTIDKNHSPMDSSKDSIDVVEKPPVNIVPEKIDKMDNNIDNLDREEGDNNNNSDSITELDIDEVRQKWKGFIEKVHIKKPSIASVLDKSVPLNIENGLITIQISSALDFHLNMIENNTEVINDMLESEFISNIGFTVEKGSSDPNDKLDENKNMSSENIEKDEQLRDKIVDLFDGEIIT
tara:strand:- start:1122 stop:2828 length:1707 start_codon:yes stop_codon:yes gene_type:complete